MAIQKKKARLAAKIVEPVILPKTVKELDSYDMTPLYGKATLVARMSGTRQPGRRVRPLPTPAFGDFLHVAHKPLPALWQQELLGTVTDTYGSLLELLRVPTGTVTEHKLYLYLLGPRKYFPAFKMEIQEEVLPAAMRGVERLVESVRSFVVMRLQRVRRGLGIALMGP